MCGGRGGTGDVRAGGSSSACCASSSSSAKSADRPCSLFFYPPSVHLPHDNTVLDLLQLGELKRAHVNNAQSVREARTSVRVDGVRHAVPRTKSFSSGAAGAAGGGTNTGASSRKNWSADAALTSLSPTSVDAISVALAATMRSQNAWPAWHTVAHGLGAQELTH